MPNIGKILERITGVSWEYYSVNIRKLVIDSLTEHISDERAGECLQTRLVGAHHRRIRVKECRHQTVCHYNLKRSMWIHIA